MGNVLSDEKQQQVIALGRLGWSLRRIEDATGVRRETASGYLRAAGVGIRPPRRWRKSKPANEGTAEASEPEAEGAGAKPANEGTTDSMPRGRAGVRHMSASIVAPYVELVRQRLEVGRNGRAIYEELVDTQGYTGSYISVRRFVRALRDSQGPEAKAVIHTAPGEEAQVDYGEGPMVRHPETGKYRRTRMFVMTLGYSRKSVRLLCWKSSSCAWAQLHEESFRRLGGVARAVVLDNLREGVLAADVYEPALNPLFRDVLAHYSSDREEINARPAACSPGMRSHARSRGLKLKQADRAALEALTHRGRESVRVLKRGRVLQLLAEGWTVVRAAEAVGVTQTTVRTVRRRYLEEGLGAALNEKPRPGAARLLTEKQASEMVAMVCASPPEGRARWTVRLIAQEAMRRGLVPKVGRETVRELLLRHDLKPWREKNVVRAQARRSVHRAHGGRAGVVCASPAFG
ncbi:helix-turn-helix domain-containing protein [Myxococcus llanfairpwllgwyngyllgogerychwyrndrobwllllantysiliogogogochensis]|uniref:Helix-turn-helix domain-containing protein n=1 Tax=Myxococcus llanfairpwllgwyngyllgogerychwyrndrobwllllantysiliogogogochensis TaxID=2590453 RepID=A0A540X097_9BACT|nr:helix-turn-helix domain-containing protein [Myxococcus llanfairpwllgwyngyllgogerychwyrndrobwllllantysiliogogogochensis]